jgi:hypothetical protein
MKRLLSICTGLCATAALSLVAMGATPPAKPPVLHIDWAKGKIDTDTKGAPGGGNSGRSGGSGGRSGGGGGSRSGGSGAKGSTTTTSEDLFYAITISNTGGPASNVTVEYREYNKTYTSENGKSSTSYAVIGAGDVQTYDTIPAGGNVTFITQKVPNKDSVTMSAAASGGKGKASAPPKQTGSTKQDFQGIWVSLKIDGKEVASKSEPSTFSKEKMEDTIRKAGGNVPN